MKKFLLGFIGLCLLAGGIAIAQAPGVNSPFQPVWSIPLDSIKRTYAAGVASLSGQAGAQTDILQICGSATTTVRVTKMAVAGRATAVSPADIWILKRSTANTGGTAQLSTEVPLDTGTSAATAAVEAYSVAPTTGTLVGTIAAGQIYLGNLTTGVGTPLLNLLWGDRPGSAVVLRGAAQCLAMNLSSQVHAGALWNVSVEWTEE